VSVIRAPSGGVLRFLGPDVRVDVYRSALRRVDWADISQAIMTAFARGADVRLLQQEDARG
ncbi:hypothetical protein JYB64_21425, partial [Algoriphagus aestuarii]|nr:hypothetical protein [Algoriphagus aestuarii]